MANDVGSGISATVEIGKNLVSLFRDAFLGVLVVLLIFWPQTFNEMLVNAGFEEGSFAGLKWKSGFAATRSQLEQANQALDNLKQANADLTRQLGEAKQYVNDDNLKAAITATQQTTQQIADHSAAVQTSVQQTINGTAQLASTLPSALQPIWVVVFGSDTKLDGAKFEIQKAASLGIPDPKVYFRNGNYRSAAVASDRPHAEALLQIAKQRRPDSYLVDLNNWCPKQSVKADYVECS